MDASPSPAPSPARRVAGWLGLHDGGPWRAKTVWLATLVVAVGLAFWLRAVFNPPPPPGVESPLTAQDWAQPLPKAVPLGVSYIGGFLIGWTFRRVLRIAFMLVLVALALAAAGKYFGWQTAAVEEQARHSSAVIQREAGQWKDWLQGRLPSAFAAGAGAFLGFRRRRTYLTAS